VQNLDDGRVKVVAEGEAGDLESLLAALDIKNTIINVVDIKSEHSPATGDFDSFVNLKENLEGRLIRIESDVSQIKAKIAL
jgi:acylphosphatase